MHFTIFLLTFLLKMRHCSDFRLVVKDTTCEAKDLASDARAKDLSFETNDLTYEAETKQKFRLILSADVCFVYAGRTAC